jgi:hypothetical protein
MPYFLSWTRVLGSLIQHTTQPPHSVRGRLTDDVLHHLNRSIEDRYTQVADCDSSSAVMFSTAAVTPGS